MKERIKKKKLFFRFGGFRVGGSGFRRVKALRRKSVRGFRFGRRVCGRGLKSNIRMRSGFRRRFAVDVGGRRGATRGGSAGFVMVVMGSRRGRFKIRGRRDSRRGRIRKRESGSRARRERGLSGRNSDVLRRGVGIGVIEREWRRSTSSRRDE